LEDKSNKAGRVKRDSIQTSFLGSRKGKRERAKNKTILGYQRRQPHGTTMAGVNGKKKTYAI